MGRTLHEWVTTCSYYKQSCVKSHFGLVRGKIFLREMSELFLFHAIDQLLVEEVDRWDWKIYLNVWSITGTCKSQETTLFLNHSLFFATNSILEVYGGHFGFWLDLSNKEGSMNTRRKWFTSGRILISFARQHCRRKLKYNTLNKSSLPRRF